MVTDFICTPAGQVYRGGQSGFQAMEKRHPVFACCRVTARTATSQEIENLYGQRHTISERPDGVLLYDGRVY